MKKTPERAIGGPAMPDGHVNKRAARFGEWAATSYGRVVLYLSRYYLAYLDENVAQYDISAAHVPLLAYLWDGHSGDTQNEIARRLGVDKGTISRTVASLVSKGLIVQSPSRLDSRACTIELTPAGWDLAKPVTAIMRAWTEKVTGGMDEATCAQVLAELQGMLKRAGDLLPFSTSGILEQLPDPRRAE